MRLKRNRGFTLIEILAVMAIIGILAVTLAPRFVGRTEDAKVAADKADIAAIEVALDAYEADNGIYVTTEQSLDALVSITNIPPVPANWKGPYLKKRAAKNSWANQITMWSPGRKKTAL